ncbi:hypothetical protein SAMN06265182_2070 [Persephonella hydrogeniphila]|uniref:Uncharacterized protein n=1 Tax=Persephonella hydrogeniphila TaxID=198703 RepID=A0A285NPL1_9AQUI|nr:hypothetical protein [Persephonella hydrogeniphila]SNZ11464.1 hypothetical protein SAMN06265182_2070 [Persephonella hydrogeniphila]
MKKVILGLFTVIFLSIPTLAQEKLMVVYLYEKGSKHYQIVNDKILKDKYLAKRINKSFNFYRIELGTEPSQRFINRYGLENTEGVFFIDPSTGKVLYKLTDFSKPCRCANLINYFSRNLHKKGIDPDRYLEMAEKLGAYQRKVEKDYLF